uniref:MICOS complex subunit n=1 Tax=Wuchereria bancrofti TaxID=6293 RepID=A0A1I8EZC0_WUCBA
MRVFVGSILAHCFLYQNSNIVHMTQNKSRRRRCARLFTFTNFHDRCKAAFVRHTILVRRSTSIFSETDEMNETLENIKSSIVRWWTAVNVDKRPKPNPARMVTVQELPMYPDEAPYYKEVQELPMPIQKEMALLRRAALQRLGNFGESYLNVEDKSKKVFNSTQEFQQFLREDYGLLPKAAAVTIGGLTGFFLGMKKLVFNIAVFTAQKYSNYFSFEIGGILMLPVRYCLVQH